MADSVEGLLLDDKEQVLLRLARGETPNSLSSEDLSVVKTWSLGLNVRSEFGRFIGWLVELELNLPLSGEVGNIRAYQKQVALAFW